MIRTACVGLVVFGVFLGSMSFTCEAADVSAGVELNSAYVWRGVTLNDGLVLQPSLILAKSGVEIFFWGNINIDDYDGTLETDEFSEIDIDVSYGRELIGLNVRLGVVQYTYPNGGSMISTNGTAETQSGTAEVYASISREIGAGISLRLDAYYDFDEVKDGYGKLTIQHADTVGDGVLITTGASMGIVGRRTALTGEDGLHEYDVFLKAAYVFESGIGIAGRLAYTDTLNKDVLPEQDTNIYGGVSLKYLF